MTDDESDSRSAGYGSGPAGYRYYDTIADYYGESFALTTDSGDWDLAGDFDTGIFTYNITDLDDFKTEISDGEFVSRIESDEYDYQYRYWSYGWSSWYTASTTGDFNMFDWATLTFEYEPVQEQPGGPGAQVPEPMSLSLLGMGLLGAFGAGFRRKK